jgi:type IV pilus assembly protein PilY1
MKTMKKALSLFLCVSLLYVNVPLPVRADDSDIFGANIQPNVMIFLDSSGSMQDDNDLIASSPYEPATTYTAAAISGTSNPVQYYDAVKVYKNPSSSGKWGSYKNSVDLVVGDTTTQTAAILNALNTAGKWTGKISNSTYTLGTGNYVNYTKSPAGALVYKIIVARRVLTNLINNTEGVRFGLAKFKNNSNSLANDGAAILAPIGSSKTTLVSALSGWTPTGYTPLGEALRDIGKYFKHQAVWKYNISANTYTSNTYDDPIQYDCQPNYVIMMTDGIENGSSDIRTEATLRKTQDHSSAIPGTQNVLVDTVGFAVPAGDKAASNSRLQTAATNGGGVFFDTEDELALETALEASIRSIMAATFSFAAPAVPTTDATGIARLYKASFESNPSKPLWRGHIKAYNRDANGLPLMDSNGKAREDADCFIDPPTNSKPCFVWDGGVNYNPSDPTSKGAMPNADATNASPPDGTKRTIYTATGLKTSPTGTDHLEDFTTANSNITYTRLGVASTARDGLINYIRGVDVYDENADGSTTDQRVSKLGDIYHSFPVLVTPPFMPGDSSYQAFREAQKNRMAILLAGANDGMLHAFRETDGKELWAFIPPDLLDNLKTTAQTTGTHEFYVDSSPIAADVQVNISGVLTWKTIVIFGERRGGPYYHALDITTPTSPVYLWSFTDSKIAETWSAPAIGKVKVGDGAGGSTDRFVAFFGGGYDTPSNNALGKAFFAVDAYTGAKLWEYYKTGGAGDSQYMNFSIPGKPLALDLDGNGYIDRLYIGDVGGQVWKFDLNPNPTATDGSAGVANLTAGMVNNWTGRRFFRPVLDTATADPNPPAAGEYYPTQAIYAAPNAAKDTDGNLWIYVGTGDRNHPLNSTTTNNRFYGIKDTGQTVTLRETDLISATTIIDTTVITNGWYFVLASTEKILDDANVFNSVVFVNSFTPTTSLACGSGGGAATMYAFKLTNGYAAIDWGTSKPYTVGNLSNATKTRSTSVGTGIPGKPIVIIAETGASSVVTSVMSPTTSEQMNTNPAPPPTSMRNILYWKENFQ